MQKDSCFIRFRLLMRCHDGNIDITMFMITSDKSCLFVPILCVPLFHFYPYRSSTLQYCSTQQRIFKTSGQSFLFQTKPYSIPKWDQAKPSYSFLIKFAYTHIIALMCVFPSSHLSSSIASFSIRSSISNLEHNSYRIFWHFRIFSIWRGYSSKINIT